MKQKQSSLLKYLRDNEEFTTAFLQEDGMSDFFKMSNESTKEKEDREKKQLPPPSNPQTVMGTRLFYLLCYNDQNNIWLLCHGCNITKGSKDTLSWFKEHSRFGSPFLSAVTEAGGLHSGLLIDKIYKESGDDYVMQIDSESIRIPCESNITKGIGEFVVSWYQQHHQGDYITNKALYEGIDDLTKVELDVIRELRNNCQDKEANKRQKYLSKVLHESTDVYRETLKQQPKASASPESEENSPSSSTSDILQAEYEARAVQQAKERWHNRYCEKDIRRLIKKAYPNPSDAANVSSSSTAKSRNIFLNELLSEAGDIGILESKQVDILLDTVKKLLGQKLPIPSRDAFKKEFLELSKSPTVKAIEDAKQEAEKQKQEKEAETLRADTEKQQKEAETMRADTEKHLRLQAEQEIIRLQQLLQTQTTIIPTTSAIAQSTSSTLVGGTAFWQAASTADTSTKKREFDATTDTQLLDPEAKSIEQPTKRAITNLLQDSNDDDDEAKPIEQATKRTATNLSPASDHDDNLNIDIEGQSTHSLG
jgi:hypothetical protein